MGEVLSPESNHAVWFTVQAGPHGDHVRGLVLRSSIFREQLR